MSNHNTIEVEKKKKLSARTRIGLAVAGMTAVGALAGCAPGTAEAKANNEPVAVAPADSGNITPVINSVDVVTNPESESTPLDHPVTLGDKTYKTAEEIRDAFAIPVSEYPTPEVQMKAMASDIEDLLNFTGDQKDLAALVDIFGETVTAEFQPDTTPGEGTSLPTFTNPGAWVQSIKEIASAVGYLHQGKVDSDSYVKYGVDTTKNAYTFLDERHGATTFSITMVISGKDVGVTSHDLLMNTQTQDGEVKIVSAEDKVKKIS